MRPSWDQQLEAAGSRVKQNLAANNRRVFFAAMKREGYKSAWRFKASIYIIRVLERTKGQPEDEIRKALREAYPFGERKYHPYKMWLKEVRHQLKLKKVDTTPMVLFGDQE